MASSVFFGEALTRCKKPLEEILSGGESKMSVGGSCVAFCVCCVVNVFFLRLYRL